MVSDTTAFTSKHCAACLRLLPYDHEKHAAMKIYPPKLTVKLSFWCSLFGKKGQQGMLLICTYIIETPGLISLSPDSQQTSPHK